ncbi:MAG: N-acetylmuramoyl-L-alanine amidase [Butyricicoccus pullicaecorum]|nr:N-acetylmuramoyl-L-alanine amidase [Butyricicoccus pullicaecorum]
MNLHKLILTKNECYQQGKPLVVRGLMLHSTGAPNTRLSRYVGPDDGLLGANQHGNHWNQFRPDGRQVCVHGFIGRLKDGTIATYQTLPWDVRGWHAGGAANNTHIGVEICEDDLADGAYFRAVYQEAVELFATLCKEFRLDPLKNIICHAEGYKQGVASNHGDVTYWFSKHNKTMDDFRWDVKEQMSQEEEDVVKRYNTVEECPGWARETVKFLVARKFLNGEEEGLNLSEDMLRILVILDRSGAFDN